MLLACTETLPDTLLQHSGFYLTHFEHFKCSLLIHLANSIETTTVFGISVDEYVFLLLFKLPHIQQCEPEALYFLVACLFVLACGICPCILYMHMCTYPWQILLYCDSLRMPGWNSMLTQRQYEIGPVDEIVRF